MIYKAKGYSIIIFNIYNNKIKLIKLTKEFEMESTFFFIHIIHFHPPILNYY